jgi:salicylate hydroxylase
MYKFNHSDYWLTPDASKAQLEELGNAIGESFKWLGQGGCDEDWSRAEELLRKTTSGAKV